MNLEFSKMQALGNDFVVLDFTKTSVELDAQTAARIADRHFGVGCDQILIIEPNDSPEIDFNYRILNSDGSEVGQCGNGARCFAKYVRDNGLSDKPVITVQTLSGVMQLSFDEQTNFVKVDMGEPVFEPERLPLDLPHSQSYSLEINLDESTQRVDFSAVSMGNPHAVILVDSVEHAPVELLGKALQAHAAFPASVNVGFMQILSPQHIALRVYERGAGETLACGSGACAAVVAGIRSGLLDTRVKVSLPGGDAHIEWADQQGSVMLHGPANHVYNGVIDI